MLLPDLYPSSRRGPSINQLTNIISPKNARAKGSASHSSTYSMFGDGRGRKEGDSSTFRLIEHDCQYRMAAQKLGLHESLDE